MVIFFISLVFKSRASVGVQLSVDLLTQGTVAVEGEVGSAKLNKMAEQQVKLNRQTDAEVEAKAEDSVAEGSKRSRTESALASDRQSYKRHE